MQEYASVDEEKKSLKSYISVIHGTRRVSFVHARVLRRLSLRILLACRRIVSVRRRVRRAGRGVIRIMRIVVPHWRNGGSTVLSLFHVLTRSTNRYRAAGTRRDKERVARIVHMCWRWGRSRGRVVRCAVQRGVRVCVWIVRRVCTGRWRRKGRGRLRRSLDNGGRNRDGKRRTVGRRRSWR